MSDETMQAPEVAEMAQEEARGMAEYIRLLAKEKRMSFRKIAEATGHNEQAIYREARGRKELRVETLIAVAHVLAGSLSQFLALYGDWRQEQKIIALVRAGKLKMST